MKYVLLLNVKKVNGKQIIFLLRKEYHSIEKGLSLRNSKKIFGSSPRKNIDELLSRKIDENEFDSVAILARESLRQYQHRGFKSLNGGAIKYDFQNIDFNLSINLLTQRRSVRTYNKKKVSKKVLSTIISQAINAPSVCNRQHWRVLFIQDKKLIDSVLKYQNGNRGFTEEIYNLAIILSDRRAFSLLEKDQTDFDSGLFAMQLMNSMTLNGIVCCPLNACLSVKKSLALYRLLDLPKYHKIAMFLSFGFPEKSMKVAISKRLESQCYFEVLAE